MVFRRYAEEVISFYAKLSAMGPLGRTTQRENFYSRSVVWKVKELTVSRTPDFATVESSITYDARGLKMALGQSNTSTAPPPSAVKALQERRSLLGGSAGRKGKDGERYGKNKYRAHEAS